MKRSIFPIEPVLVANPRRFRITLNWPLIQQNIAREEGRSVHDSEIQSLFERSGFVRDGDGWVVDESALSILQSAEVLHAQPLTNPSP